MKRALFVEGPNEPLSSSHPFVRLWQQAILANLNLPAFDFIYPINKKFLISMRPGAPKISGASLKLDVFIEQKRRADNFDCAVVAWDLVPGWFGGIGQLCRWNETLEFYQGMARSEVLPPTWTNFAEARVADLIERPEPGARPAITRLAPGAVLAICMDTVFESLVASDEKAVRELLGCSGKQVPKWPKSWKALPSRVDTDVLGPSIAAVRALRPKVPQAFTVRGDLITAKHEWGEFFLRSMLAPAGSQKARTHPIAVRLRELL
jgi:hypothetical protein